MQIGAYWLSGEYVLVLFLVLGRPKYHENIWGWHWQSVSILGLWESFLIVPWAGCWIDGGNKGKYSKLPDVRRIASGSVCRIRLPASLPSSFILLCRRLWMARGSVSYYKGTGRFNFWSGQKTLPSMILIRWMLENDASQSPGNVPGDICLD